MLSLPQNSPTTSLSAISSTKRRGAGSPHSPHSPPRNLSTRYCAMLHLRPCATSLPPHSPAPRFPPTLLPPPLPCTPHTPYALLLPLACAKMLPQSPAAEIYQL